MYTIEDCFLIPLETVESDTEGYYSPFQVKRVFYSYDIPCGEARGAHAHKECHQLLVALNGSYEVVLDDGKNRKVIRLDSPKYGLHIPPHVWAAEQNFTLRAICLVLASHAYSEEDYIRSYDEYLKFRGQ
jgi:hypothetical protein